MGALRENTYRISYKFAHCSATIYPARCVYYSTVNRLAIVETLHPRAVLGVFREEAPQGCVVTLPTRCGVNSGRAMGKFIRNTVGKLVCAVKK